MAHYAPRYGPEPWEKGRSMRLVVALNHGSRRGVCASLWPSIMGEGEEYAPRCASQPWREGSMRLMTVSHPKDGELYAPHDRLSP